MQTRTALRKALLLLAATLASFPLASFAIFRAYVSSTGSDANPCTLQQPCRLLPAALAAVDAGGEIWMLDSANFNTGTVLINKSVSLLAVPGVVGSVVATGGSNAIQVDTPGVHVSLRNLVIVPLGSGSNGVLFTQGASLTVSECEISAVQGAGILASAPNGVVTVRDTTVRRAGTYGIAAFGAQRVVLDRVNLHHNETNALASTGARMTISRSTLSGGTYGMRAQSPSGSTVVVIDRTVVVDANVGVLSDGGDGFAEVMVSNSTLAGHSSAAVRALAGEFTASSVMVLDGNTFSKNHIAIDNAGGNGVVVINTRRNNTLRFNNIDTNGSIPAEINPF